jgi:uncharacterized protein YcbK (DUF882 family)
MQLTSNFSLEELTRSADATKLKIANRPSMNEINNLKALAENVLQPLRDAVGVISINSGYRCKKLNDAVGGSDTSQHMLGQAADFKCADMAKAFDHIKKNLPFDQLIWEHGNDTQPAWIHVSYSPRHRKQVIRIK